MELELLNDSCTSIAFIFYSTKYWRTRQSHPTMSDIEQAEQDALTIYDILTDGLGLLTKNIHLISDPSFKNM